MIENFFFTENNLWIMKSYNDTLYRITKEQTIEPYLVLYRGKYTPELSDKDKEKIFLGRYNEIGPYSFFIASDVFQIWNHETGKLIALKKTNSNTPNGTIGNFNYQLPNKQIVQMNLISIKDGKLIFIIKPSMDKTTSEYLKLKEDDNPAIMIADLKINN